MRKLLFVPLVLLAMTNAVRSQMGTTELQQYVDRQLQRVAQLWQENRIEEAMPILETLRATPGIEKLESVWMNLLYNLACAHSRLGHKDQALAALGEAVTAGFSDFGLLQRDTDLDSIRPDPRFQELAGQARAKGQFWDNPVWETPYRPQLSADEMAAGLAKLWAEIKYDFVWYDRLALANWDSLYMAFLPRVRDAQSTLAYFRLLSEMCAHLHDGHTRVNAPNELVPELYYCPPLKTLQVEGRVLITAVLDDSLRKSGIVPGLQIVRIDGTAVKEYAEREFASSISVSTAQALTWQMYSYYLLCGPRQKPVELSLQDAKGREFTRALPRNRVSWAHPPVTYRRVGRNIAYVTLPTFGSDEIARQFDSLFADVATADALILDLRDNTGGNSAVGYAILGCLTDSIFAALRSSERIYRPGHRPYGSPPDSWETELVTWPPNGRKLFSRPVALLIGPATGSAAEDFAVAFEVMKRGKLIGEPTGGSTGQPLTFALPGGLAGIVCVDWCTYPDGKEFVGIGIQPDIIVHSTIKSIRAGRDPVLEAAIQHLEKHGR